jgi:2,3-dihydroxybenzoate decarboxylase
VTFQGDLRKFKEPLTHYFQENFYLTTSGFFSTPALDTTLLAIGEDRVLFSTDYPYESMHVAADWFDNADINENTREKIGRTNAQRLFGLKH